uniref:Uncharacterized protein n=1 Tax=Romanomermis culicivorax TaxID=13658 RepID=A0A915JLL0_ROMCU
MKIYAANGLASQERDSLSCDIMHSHSTGYIFIKIFIPLVKLHSSQEGILVEIAQNCRHTVLGAVEICIHCTMPVNAQQVRDFKYNMGKTRYIGRSLIFDGPATWKTKCNN